MGNSVPESQRADQGPHVGVYRLECSKNGQQARGTQESRGRPRALHASYSLPKGEWLRCLIDRWVYTGGIR